MSSDTKQSQVIYESVRAPHDYILAYNALMEQPSNQLRVRAVAALLRHVGTGIRRVVDVASGGGAYVRAARLQLGGEPRFFPVDRQFGCVGGYRLNHPGAPGTLADVTRLPFRAGSFDVALCLDIVEHLDDDRGFLQDVSDVLKPGGWMVVSTHNSRSLTHVIGLLTSAIRGTRWLGWDPTHVRFYNEATLRSTLAAAGMEVVAVRGTYFFPFHLPARIASWPLERAGFTSIARVVYQAIHAPFYVLNYPFELAAESRLLRGFGWGVIALARRPVERTNR